MEEEESRREIVDFIKLDLIPEMVHNRCFCEIGSREFVEFESASAKKLMVRHRNERSGELYRIRATIRFSGEPREFFLVAKILTDDDESRISYSSFLNEEMFYSKIAAKYRTESFPRCYAADMGRYGKPIVVLEDLQTVDYFRVDRKLDEDHLRLCAEFLGTFHGRGLRLRNECFDTFREFYAKLIDTHLDDETIEDRSRATNRISEALKSLSDRRYELGKKIEKCLGENPLRTARDLLSKIDEASTICHGNFSRDNLLFKYDEERPIDVKVIDWQTMRYCSPAVDLGLVLLENLACDSPLLERLLTFYVGAVKREYPEITSERFKREIVSKLPHTCVLLSAFLGGELTSEDLVSTLLRLDAVGAFD